MTGGPVVTLLAAVAWSAPSEEVVVYADEFVRWDKTRWWIQDQMVLPSGLLIAAENNLAFQTHAVQVRAIVACDKDARLSSKRWEVSCTIEDIGIRATTMTHWRPVAHAQAQQILDQVDGRLTGARVQMQVDNQGGISNFDLEGVSADNSRERAAQEALRTLVNQLMAGFHLKIPDQAQRDGQWVEQHTELLDIPSVTASRGSTVVVHQASPYKGDRLVQTVGHGTVAVAVSYTGNNPFNQSMLVQTDGTDTAKSFTGGAHPPLLDTGPGATWSIAAVSPIVFPAPDLTTPTEASFSTAARAGEQRLTELEATWDAKLSAVALFHRATGIMAERVWVASATATGGSVEGTGPYLNTGRLTLLDPEDKPSVGTSKQVAWPGQEMDGLEPWTELEAR